jgi:hypothetical protein
MKKAIASIVALITLSTAASASGDSLSTDDAVLPPDAQVLGLSMAQWSTKWWQWALSIPGMEHPLIDGSDADCSVGNSGNVWFLGAALGGIDDVIIDTRDCTVPQGTFLFMPVINVECSKIEGVGTNLEELRECANTDQDAVTILEAEIDGVPVANLDDYRVETDPLLFSFWLPEDNIFDTIWGEPDVPAGFYEDEAVGEGFYIMIRPLSPGEHTIHIRGVIPSEPGLPFGGFENEITYNLTVE